MSKARRIADSERTAIMTDLVRQEYPSGDMSISTVVIEEVAPGTGFSSAQRWADMLALGVWPSRGLSLTGYEIKASRADLRKELRDLSKHKAVARYCNEWILVAWDNDVLDCGIEVPAEWGITITHQNEDGDRELKLVRKPMELTPETWPRAFVCSMVRNAYQQAPGAHYVARAIQEATLRTLEQTTKLEKSKARGAMYDLLSPLRDALYGKDAWRNRDTPEETIKAVLAKLDQGIFANA